MEKLEGKYLIINSNRIDIGKFERLLNNNDQGYKFFWLEAIIRLSTSSPQFEELYFEEIINEMIWESWRTVTYYHLRLGHTVNGKTENFLEQAIRILYKNSKQEIGNKNISRNKLLSLIDKYNDKLVETKNHLTDYVPYRLLKPFVDIEGKGYIDKKQYGRFIAYLEQYNRMNSGYFYSIVDSVNPLQKRIRINDDWRDFMKLNYSVVMGWIQYNKACFIQDRNPGVPGVMSKISPESEENRKSLEKARNLWSMTVSLTGNPLYEIYTGQELDEKNFELDHFVPRSFSSNDELWNLTPLSKSLNINKSNKLPRKKYIGELIKYQYYLYKLIFDNDNSEQSATLKQLLYKCAKQHLNANWALDKLYVNGNSSTSFGNILSENLDNLYEAAKLQDYEIWEI